MRRMISILAIAVLMMSIMSVTSFAHGYNAISQTRPQQQPYHELCTVDGCDIVGPHQHDGLWYCNQTEYCNQAGYCANYETCTVAGCTQPGFHEHNGTYYRGATYGAGRGCGRCWNQ